MTNKNIKFISTNMVVMILLLIVLISHYTLIGLISYLVGSVLLFLGTLLDEDKSNYGVSCKLSYILFIITLILGGMWLPSILNEKAYFQPQGNVNGLLLFISLALSISSYILYRMQIFEHYVVTRLLKYSSQALLFLGIYCCWGIPLNTYFFIALTAAIAYLTDLFATKYIKYNTGEFEDQNNDAAFGMALIINLCILAMNLFYRDYFQMCLSKEHLSLIIQKATSGFNMPIFAVLIIALASIFIYLQSKEDSYSQLSDSYLALSLIGFVFLFNVYELNKSIYSFIILCVAIIAYLIFGFSIPSAEAGSRSNPIYFLIKNHKFKAMVDVVSVIITVISMIGIVFANRGYIVPIIFFICASSVILVSFIILSNNKDSWIKINVHWQVTLLSALVFLVSVAAVNNTLNHSLLFLIMLFLISTIAIWALGVRQDVINYKYSQIAQCVACIASLGIGMIAVI